MKRGLIIGLFFLVGFVFLISFVSASEFMVKDGVCQDSDLINNCEVCVEEATCNPLYEGGEHIRRGELVNFDLSGIPKIGYIAIIGGEYLRCFMNGEKFLDEYSRNNPNGIRTRQVSFFQIGTNSLECEYSGSGGHEYASFKLLNFSIDTCTDSDVDEYYVEEWCRDFSGGCDADAERMCYITGGPIIGSWDYYISKVSFNNINRISKRYDDKEGYKDNTAEFKTFVERGKTYTLSVDMGFYNTPIPSTSGITVWFDWDNDGDFYDEAGTYLGTLYSNGPPYTVSKEITIPDNAVEGPLVMRVVAGNQKYKQGGVCGPCEGDSLCGEAEVEDYSICVIPSDTDPNVDCDDSDPDVNPGETEICGNGKDDDCDGLIDEGCEVEVEAQTCSDESQIILRLSSETNAHGEVWNGAGNYPVEICYDEIFGVQGNGNRVCSGENKVLGLSANTNAHAEIPSLDNYETEVCYGDLECISQSGNCIEPYKLVVSLSANTNAHLSSDNDYPIKICCKPPTEEIILSSAKWTDLNNNEITNAQVGQTVRLTIEGSPNNELVDIVIKDENILWPDYTIREDLYETIGETESGKIKIDYTITQDDYDSGAGDRKFYFIGTSSSDNSVFIKSGILDVIPELCQCSDGTLCGTCSGTEHYYCPENADGGDLIEYCGLVEGENCGLCPSGYECIEEYCIKLPETVINCSGYENETTCEEDEFNVAVYTWEVEYGNDEESCSSYSEGDCDYDISCKCKWNETIGCIGSKEQTKTCDDGTTTTGECNAFSKIINGCDEEPLDLRKLTINYSYVGDGNCSDLDCCPEDSKMLERKCLSQVILEFFNFISVIVALIIIIVFYIIVKNKKKKEKNR